MVWPPWYHQDNVDPHTLVLDYCTSSLGWCFLLHMSLRIHCIYSTGPNLHQLWMQIQVYCIYTYKTLCNMYSSACNRQVYLVTFISHFHMILHMCELWVEKEMSVKKSVFWIEYRFRTCVIATENFITFQTISTILTPLHRYMYVEFGHPMCFPNHTAPWPSPMFLPPTQFFYDVISTYL